MAAEKKKSQTKYLIAFFLIRSVSAQLQYQTYLLYGDDIFPNKIFKKWSIDNSLEGINPESNVEVGWEVNINPANASPTKFSNTLK